MNTTDTDTATPTAATTAPELRWAIFAGSSDDTFGIVEGSAGVPTIDDDDCAQFSPRVIFLKAPDGSELMVCGQYADFRMEGGRSGNWMVGILAPDSWENSGAFWPWKIEALHAGNAALKRKVHNPAPISLHLLVEMPVGTLIQVDDGEPKNEERRGMKWGVVR